MSLVSNFVIMVDGKWYKNATIYDKTNNWFICFDDDDEPELVIHSLIQLSEAGRVKRINNILSTSKINATILSNRNSGDRVFPSDSIGVHKPAISAYLKIKERIDLKDLKVQHDGVTKELPTHLAGYVTYDFKERR